MTERRSRKVQRGMVTAAGLRERGQTVEPPLIVRRAELEPEPPGPLYRYVTNAARFYQIKVVTLKGEDRAALRERPLSEGASEDEVLTRLALGALRDDYIVFSDYAYGTQERRVAAWLDDRIRRGVLIGVARDSQQMKVRCAYHEEDGAACAFWVFNTRHGLEEMARHILEDHDTYDEEIILPPLDNGLNALDEESRSTAELALAEAEGEKE